MVVDYYERTHFYQIVVCARHETDSVTPRVLDLGPGRAEVLWWVKASLTLPERMSQVGLNLRPCGHGAEALLDEPPSHVRKLTLTIPPDGVAGQRAREGCLLLQMPEAVVLGVVLPLQSWDIVFIGIICNGWDQ